jgi:hypothetical protein
MIECYNSTFDLEEIKIDKIDELHLTEDDVTTFPKLLHATSSIEATSIPGSLGRLPLYTIASFPDAVARIHKRDVVVHPSHDVVYALLLRFSGLGVMTHSVPGVAKRKRKRTVSSQGGQSQKELPKNVLNYLRANMKYRPRQRVCFLPGGSVSLRHR